MQPSYLSFAHHGDIPSSTAESGDDSVVFVRVWSCPGELGVPVDDAAGVQAVSPPLQLR